MLTAIFGWCVRVFCCSVRNNITPSVTLSDGATADHNYLWRYSDRFFVDPTVFDFHLRPDAPVIDMGSSVLAPEIDLDGHRRPQGKGYDIGAYEFPSEF